MKLGKEEFKELLIIADIDAVIETIEVINHNPYRGIFYSCKFNVLGGGEFEFIYHTGYGFQLFDVTNMNDIGVSIKTYLPNQLKLWEKLFELNGSKLIIGENTIDV